MRDDEDRRRAHDIRASLINLRGFCGELETVIATVAETADADVALAASRRTTGIDGAPLPLEDARFCVSSIRSLVDRLERQLQRPGGATE